MMMKRWLIRGSLLLLLLGIVAQPAVHWRLRGWAKCESFYRGRPTSYWQAVVKVREESRHGWCVTGMPPPVPAAWWQGWIPGFTSRPSEPLQNLIEGDPAVRPVLDELQNDPDPDVRNAVRWIEEENWDRIAERSHAAHISPDVNPAMNGLLNQQRGSQLFTVFDQPRTQLQGPDQNGAYTVIMEGVDIYNPVTNSIDSTGGQKVAAWFLDGDYDGRTFCITQAFIPDRSAREKLAKALGGIVDPERFEALSGTVSLPFPPGKHKCVGSA